MRREGPWSIRNGQVVSMSIGYLGKLSATIYNMHIQLSALGLQFARVVQ